jgi:hypothetical protein
VQGSLHLQRRQIFHTVAIFGHEGHLLGAGWKVGDREGFAIWRLAMFKLPSYDPVSIAVMGFGILLVAALALSLG